MRRPSVRSAKLPSLRVAALSPPESDVGGGCPRLAETHRVLAPGGKYVVVSYGEPEDRLPALQQPRFEWTLIDQATLRKNNARFYVYVLLKAERS